MYLGTETHTGSIETHDGEEIIFEVTCSYHRIKQTRKSPEERWYEIEEVLVDGREATAEEFDEHEDFIHDLCEQVYA
jgi:hypothetical protein